MKIDSIDAFQIYDSRGFPTIETEVRLSNGAVGYGLVPSGASTGQYEAHELRDGDPALFRGKSVYAAVDHVRGEIFQSLRGKNAEDQVAIDRAMIELDGTENKTRLGANAILGVSMAVARAAAASREEDLFAFLGEGHGNLVPLPEIQVIGGGAHANWRTDVQDFLLIANGARSFHEVMEVTFLVYHAAGDLLRERSQYYGVADEGGFWPEFDSNEEVFDLIIAAIEQAGFVPGKDVSISLDIAASDLFDESTQSYRFQLDDRSFSKEEFADLMISWCDRYPVLSIEDPVADTDWEGWQRITASLGDHVQIVGDDLFTTNLKRIGTGVEKRAANAVLIKLNQIGSVTETLEAIRQTQSAGWLPVISARSGETEDAFISHLAVATNAGQLKVGSFSRGERMAKWNEILRIERKLGDRANFVGSAIYERIFLKKDLM